MTPAPLQLGQAPSELALNSVGFTPLAFANALRIGSSSPVYVAGLLRREPRIEDWSTDTTPSRPETEPRISELLPEPATPATTTSTPSGRPAAPARGAGGGAAGAAPARPHPRRVVAQRGERGVGGGGPEVVGAGAAHLQRPRRRAHRWFQGGPVVQ